MSSTLLLPPREQLCNRSCSNKTHTFRSLDEDLHRGRQAPARIALWSLRMITLPRSCHSKVLSPKSQWLGSDLLSAWWLGLAPATLEFWVRFPNERNQGEQAHPVLNYRVPQGSQSPHRPRLVVSRSTCPPLSSPPHANSFVIGPAVIKHTHTFSDICGAWVVLESGFGITFTVALLLARALLLLATLLSHTIPFPRVH